MTLIKACNRNLAAGAACLCFLLAASPGPLHAGFACRAFPPPSLPATSILTVTIVDASTGDTIPARCSVTDSYGYSRYPRPDISFYHEVEEGYFYCPGRFSVNVPEGAVTVRTGHGFEFRGDVRIIDVEAGTDAVIALERICDMRAGGWYPGEVHAHVNHGAAYYRMYPSDVLFVGKAEDLAVINCLDNEYCFTGAPDPCSTEDCVVYMTEEKRSGVYGHYGLLGLKTLLQPPNENWGEFLANTADAAHLQDGAIVIAAHPVSSDDFDQIIVWPGSGIARELPVDAIGGRVDAVEIMSYSNMGWGVQTGLWYDLLNCGFRIPCCAGTDSPLNHLTSYPAGGFRTYVDTGENGFSYHSWLDGIREGRTFATNGPLFSRFAVLGFGAGDSLMVFRGEYNIPVEVTVECAYPMDRVEIVRNGSCVKTIYTSTDPCRIDTLVDIRVSESSWIAARALGRNGNWFTRGDSLFAHTSPFYMIMGNARINERFAARRLADWTSAAIEILVERSDWPSPGDSLATLAFFVSGKEYYERLAGIACDAGGISGENGVPESLSLRSAPNPFNSTALIRLDGAGTDRGASLSGFSVTGLSTVAVSVFDVAGRRVRRLFEGRTEDLIRGLYWDGRDDSGKDAPSGVYFVRAGCRDRVLSWKMILMR